MYRMYKSDVIKREERENKKSWIASCVPHRTYFSSSMSLQQDHRGWIIQPLLLLALAWVANEASVDGSIAFSPLAMETKTQEEEEDHQQLGGSTSSTCTGSEEVEEDNIECFVKFEELPDGCVLLRSAYKHTHQWPRSQCESYERASLWWGKNNVWTLNGTAS